VKILVLGAQGMMGHMVCRVLGERHELVGTLRGPFDTGDPIAAHLDEGRCIGGLDVTDEAALRAVIERVGPDAVINCVGIVKQLAAAHDALLSIRCNSLLPHQLAAICADGDARLVHLSTDCVFSGRRGRYTETDLPDPVDLYGRSKLLGETSEAEALTIRTSIVGRQIAGHTSLFEWVLGQAGSAVKGFTKAIYTGLTTYALTQVIEEILLDHPDLSGVWQIASDPISKFDLIVELDRRLDLGLEITADSDFECDRSLDGSRFAAATGIVVPSWDAMLDQFAADQPTYTAVGGALA